MIARALRTAATAVLAVLAVGGVSVVAAGALTGGVETLAIADEQAAVLVDEAPLGATDAAGASRGTAGSGTSRVSDAWIDRTSAATGIGPIALRAYAEATLSVATEQPTCHLGWTTLAGIAEIESGHGTYGGATLAPDGRPTAPIVGPALDGSEGLAAIRSDAEGTARHGDPTWDRAVGPFQFIGSTWQRWGSDGDGDGVADPQDVDDAALAAGRYLCASGADLRTGAGWNAAIHSYNHSDAYVAAVLAAATRHASARP